MELNFGGAYQGKTQYAAQKYDLTDADIFTCEDLDLDPDARCIRHLERFARACTEAGLDAREEFARRSPRACVLIADDISCGIVPLDRSERTWREASGRLLSSLAAQADTVTRIFCGLPLARNFAPGGRHDSPVRQGRVARADPPALEGRHEPHP